MPVQPGAGDSCPAIACRECLRAWLQLSLLALTFKRTHSTFILHLGHTHVLVSNPAPDSWPAGPHSRRTAA